MGEMVMHQSDEVSFGPPRLVANSLGSGNVSTKNFQGIFPMLVKYYVFHLSRSMESEVDVLSQTLVLLMEKLPNNHLG